MEIHRGTSRISFVGDRYTVKIPRIKMYIVGSILQVLKQHKTKGYSIDITKKRLGNEVRTWYQKNIENIRSNKNEARLGDSYPEIVMSTKLSILGLLNIQESGEIIKQDINDKLWKQMITYASNHNNIIREGHTFYEGGNFVRDKSGNFKLIDAGSYTMADTLESEGANICAAMQEVEKTYFS